MMATPYREFSFSHADFHLHGLFNICEPMLVEASNGLRGFKIESVRRFLTDDHAVEVPTCISDFVEAWAETPAGKAKLQAAYEDALPAKPLHDEDHPDNPAPVWRSARAAA